MEFEVKIEKYDNAIVAKFDNRRMYLMKNNDGDNIVIFKTMHPIQDNDKILSPKNAAAYEKVTVKMNRVITEKVICLSDEAIDILKYLKDKL